MRYRESGMPSEQIWDTFFNPIEISTDNTIKALGKYNGEIILHYLISSTVRNLSTCSKMHMKF